MATYYVYPDSIILHKRRGFRTHCGLRIVGPSSPHGTYVWCQQGCWKPLGA